jgi:hypothetical protein
MQPALDAWAAEKADFPNYDAGSDGPKATDEPLGSRFLPKPYSATQIVGTLAELTGTV